MKLRYADFRQLTRSRTAAAPVASKSALAGAAVELVRSAYPLAKGVRLLGVTVSGFEPGERADEAQVTFDFGEPARWPR